MRSQYETSATAVRPWAEVVRMLEERSGIKVTENNARMIHTAAIRKMRGRLALLVPSAFEEARAGR